MPLLIEEKFNIEASDQEILETFHGWFAESELYHDVLKRAQDKAEQYYLGNQTDRDLIPDYLSNAVENRIFEGVETLVPVATASAHQFVVMPGGDNELSLRKADVLQKVMTKKYDDLDMQEKLEELTRKMLLYRFGVAKYSWSDYKDDVCVEEIDPRMIYIPKLNVDPHMLPYVIEAQEYSYNEMLEYFPNAKIESLSESGGAASAKTNDAYSRRTYRVFEVWTDEMVAWISSGEVLDKRENPYWDFEGEDIEERGDYLPGGKRPAKKTRKIFRNHLNRPEKPYVFFTTYRVSDSPVAPVSLVEIGMPVQDAINVENRQIIDGLRRMGNGRVLIDSDAMAKEESDNITNEPGITIRGEGLASGAKIKFEPGTPIPNAHFAHLQNMKSTFDNLLGVHSATRGAAGAKTLGQDIISRQQDFTRIDLITRVLNRGVKRLADGLVQLMKLYYTDIHVVKILGEDGAVEFVKLTQDDIEDHIEIIVKSGNTLPMDEISLRTEGVQMWQLGAIDPITLYERLKFPNPEKSAERLVSWKSGQLTMESQAKIAEAKAGVMARASAAPAEKGRAVETPLNVLQRARAGVGGTAPVAAGTPNM